LPDDLLLYFRSVHKINTLLSHEATGFVNDTRSHDIDNIARLDYINAI